MKAVTALLVAGSFFSSPFVVRALNFGDDKPTVSFVLLIPAIIAIGVLALSGMNEVVGGGDERPLKAFRLASYSFIAMGGGAFFFQWSDLSENGSGFFWRVLVLVLMLEFLLATDFLLRTSRSFR